MFMTILSGTYHLPTTVTARSKIELYLHRYRHKLVYLYYVYDTWEYNLMVSMVETLFDQKQLSQSEHQKITRYVENSHDRYELASIRNFWFIWYLSTYPWCTNSYRNTDFEKKLPSALPIKYLSIINYYNTYYKIYYNNTIQVHKI